MSADVGKIILPLRCCRLKAWLNRDWKPNMLVRLAMLSYFWKPLYDPKRSNLIRLLCVLPWEDLWLPIQCLLQWRTNIWSIFEHEMSQSRLLSNFLPLRIPELLSNPIAGVDFHRLLSCWDPDAPKVVKLFLAFAAPRMDAEAILWVAIQAENRSRFT